ncbi:MAG TPA: glycosyltransferase [Stellaceae bacterium]|nr:glycosyltransferase [Stellaceae bacterium]
MPEPTAPAATRPISARKQLLRELSDRFAARRDEFIARNRAFHEDDRRYLKFLIPPGQNVLEIGCGTGGLLAALDPARGIGIDLSPGMIEIARRAQPGLDFVAGDIEDPATVEALVASGPFDAIVLADTIGMLDDCQATLAGLHPLCHRDTRLIVAYHNYLWEPVLRLAEKTGLRMPEPLTNWLRPADIANLLDLADFRPVREEWRQLIPKRLLGIGSFVNRFIATLPLIRRLCLRNYLVARPYAERRDARAELSASVIVPCRNERGNIAPLVARTPRFCRELEIIFVEGNSRDGTYEEIERVKTANPQYDIKLLKQDGKGKGDAVHKGFAAAHGDIVMILDADMTMPPEELPKFYDALARDKGEFINGTRLVYPLERDAMRLLNRIANHVFSALFSWLLNQRFTDTLCGTKALRRSHYRRIVAGRAYFGDFDPFGDFDLIFGASKLSLELVEVPIRYQARSYGETQISRFRHGWLLLRMVVFAYFKLKAPR